MTNALEPPPGWVSISDLARERKVDKSAVSRRVARLEVRGLLLARKVGNTKLVNLAEFDRAIAATVDGVRELNGRGATGAPEAGAAAAGDPVLAREQARRAGYDADLKRLDLEERLGQLVQVEAVRVSAEAWAIELARVIDTLPGRADALAAAVTKEGVAGLRAGLRAFTRELRETLARAAERFADGEEFGDAEAAEASPEEAAA